MKILNVSTETWKRVQRIRINRELSSVEEVVKILLDNYEQK